MNLVIVALDAESLWRCTGIAAHCAHVKIEGVIADGWNSSVSGPAWITHDQLMTRNDRNAFHVLVTGGAVELNQKRLARFMEYKSAGLRIGNLVGVNSSLADGVRIRENSLLASNVLVDPGADLGANIVIGANTTIGAGARLGHSAWIGAGCSIGSGARIGKNCVLGDGVRVASNVVLEPWSALCADYHLESTPGMPLFVDPLFRAPVFLHGIPS